MHEVSSQFNVGIVLHNNYQHVNLDFFLLKTSQTPLMKCRSQNDACAIFCFFILIAPV